MISGTIVDMSGRTLSGQVQVVTRSPAESLNGAVMNYETKRCQILIRSSAKSANEVFS